MKTIGALVAGREEMYHLAPQQSVREAARYMTERRVGAVCVLEGSRLVGVLSERDIMGRVVAPGLDLDRTTVGEVMTRDLVVAQAGDSLDDALRRMKQAGCRHLPVVEDDKLVGMVAQRDLLQVDLSEKDEEIRWLNAYIHFIPPVREGTS
jgi:CBS domain-containing protein